MQLSKFENHPARPAALAELHARPAPHVNAPATLMRLVLANRGMAQGPDPELLERLCTAFGAAAPPPGARYHAIACDGGELRWEQHTEFVTCTLHIDKAGSADRELDACTNLIGDVVRHDYDLLAAVVLVVEAQMATPGEPSADYCISEIAGGRAILFTDFKADTRGFTHYRLADRGLPAAERGVFAQRILEIETYRVLALLALPLARSAGSAVREIETQLQTLTARIQMEKPGQGAELLFGDLSRLAARIEGEIAATTYRFAAAAAYGAIVQDRLAGLREQAFEGHPQAGRFLLTRLTPALRTCESMQAALAGLAQRCARASDLMRTRIDLQLAQQNNDLLAALDARTKLQMRLQQTVEGLSIAALSYYVAGIVLYLFKGAKEAGLISFDPAIAIAATIPVIVIGVAGMILRIRRMHSSDR